ncbi:MAG: shikimate kinase, partial [Ktedonobacterales bacterium]
METSDAASQPPASQPVQCITLIGPTGAGKTTVGGALAALLGWRFLDLDRQIISAAGLPIHDIFAREGEAGFRSREAAALRAALYELRVVIACGAGAVEGEGALTVALERGWVVALEVAPETALARATVGAKEQGQTVGELRPLLEGPDPLARIRELMARRRPFYAQAHATRATDALAPDAIAARIAAELIALGLLAPTSSPSPAVRERGTTEAQALAAPDASVVTRRVQAGAGYDAVVGWGALAELPARLRALGLPPRLSVVTDSAVADLYLAPLLERLRAAEFAPDALVVPVGEESKSRELLGAIHDWLAERRIERGEALLALGGGVVG